jgi:hypothetical protein
MISNERPSPYASRPQRPKYPSTSFPPAYNKPPSQETTLRTERLQVERKTFVFMLKENDRGRFLRIVEEANGHRDTIIVPSTGLEDFNRLVAQMVAPTDPAPTVGE